MIRLLIFLYDGRCWLRQYTQPLQHFTSHLGRPVGPLALDSSLAPSSKFLSLEFSLLLSRGLEACMLHNAWCVQGS